MLWHRSTITAIPGTGNTRVLRAVDDGMLIITQNEFGGPEVLIPGEAPIPEPLPTEVRVLVHAAGINPVDAKTRRGSHGTSLLGRPPFILGWDVAGVVDAVGAGVTAHAVGDRVFGMPWFPRQAGAYAEYVTAPSRQFARIPDGVGFAAAAALPLAGLTAFQLLTAGGVTTGTRVLVNGASGGVGHLVVQRAVELGAIVTGTASRRNFDFVRSLGTSAVVDYHDDGWQSTVGDIDVVLDFAAADRPDDPLAIDALRAGGRYLLASGGLPDRVSAAAAERGVSASAFLVEPDAVALAELVDSLTSGTLVPEVGATFPLAEVADAHRLLESGTVPGKIVLIVTD
jgi:NADPH:quinone reductase-like Zn-dependent oxidoreductase